MGIELNSPYMRESFACDFLEGRTVRGTSESVEYLTKMNVYYSKSKKKRFEKRAFIRPHIKSEKPADQ